MYKALKNAGAQELRHNRNEPLPANIKGSARAVEEYAKARQKALGASYKYFNHYGYPIVGTGSRSLGVQLRIGGATQYRRI
jgi:hypothetical protein